MENEPLVSIITPVYNRSHILPEAIKSIINQTYQNWELLVVDDRSTDDTRKIVNKLIESDNRIKYLLNDRKKGPAGARNHGILNCQGEYIAFLDSDDQWLPHHLTDAIRILTNENVNICFASWYGMHSGKLMKYVEVPEIQEWFLGFAKALNAKNKGTSFIFGDGFYEMAVLEKVYCYHINTLVLNKTVIRNVGLFNEHLFTTEDTEFFLRMFHDYDFCFINEPHAIYNESDDSLYSFIDHNTLNPNMVSGNQELIDKLTFQGKYKILMRKIHRKFILKSKKIKDKKIYLEYLDNSIAKKYFTLGFINQNTHKIISIYYYLNSFHYKKDWKKLVYIGKVICPAFWGSIQIDPSSFDFL